MLQEAVMFRRKACYIMLILSFFKLECTWFWIQIQSKQTVLESFGCLWYDVLVYRNSLLRDTYYLIAATIQ